MLEPTAPEDAPLRDEDLEALWALLEGGRPVRNYVGDIFGDRLHIHRRDPPAHWSRSIIGGTWSQSR